MRMQKTLLAAAMLAGLYSISAFAQVNIGDNDPSNAVKLAKELTIPSGGLTLTGTAFGIQTQQGFNMSAGEVRYARLECDTNVKFATASVLVKPANAAVGAINGIGTNAISFSITAQGGPLLAADSYTIDGNRTLTVMGNADCRFSLYDQPSQASTGGTTGRINLISDRYLTPTASVKFINYPYSNSPFTRVATVNATPAFSKFAPGNVTTAYLSHIHADDSGTLDASGNVVYAGQINGAGSAIYVDLMGAAIGPGKIYLSSGNCPGASAPGSVVMDPATNTIDVSGKSGHLSAICYEVAATNTAPIPAMNLKLTLQSKPGGTTFNPTNYGPIDGGKIIHDGTTLQASLVQRPDGWLSRIVLVNNGTVARNYEFRVVGEAGNTITTTAANMTGSIPANSQKVIDVNSLLTGFSAAPRSAILVDIAAPSTEVEGLYQIVNPDTGGIDNSQMVRAGNP